MLSQGCSGNAVLGGSTGIEKLEFAPDLGITGLKLHSHKRSRAQFVTITRGKSITGRRVPRNPNPSWFTPTPKPGPWFAKEWKVSFDFGLPNHGKNGGKFPGFLGLSPDFPPNRTTHHPHRTVLLTLDGLEITNLA